MDLEKIILAVIGLLAAGAAVTFTLSKIRSNNKARGENAVNQTGNSNNAIVGNNIQIGEQNKNGKE
ncbi:hypothetical protein NSS90_09675 [Bacillus sp. PS93]|uniref:hypothetical protein n=1 Tax=unclassified Bacillus (in: firmicutes) TaxID=185979 RepID=UPI0030CE4E35